MPEYRECVAHYILIVWLWLKFRKLKLGSSAAQVKGLWADLTDSEARLAPYKKIKSVIRLNHSSPLVRGARMRQTHLWPPQWAEGRPGAQPITDLRLERIDFTGRAMILDFGPLMLKVHYTRTLFDTNTCLPEASYHI